MNKVEKILGPCKQGETIRVRDKDWKNVKFFSAVIHTEDGEIWHGDIDLTTDEPKLKQLGRELNKEIFLLNEATRTEIDLERDASWSSNRGPMNMFKTLVDKGIYVNRDGKWFHK